MAKKSQPQSQENHQISNSDFELLQEARERKAVAAKARKEREEVVALEEEHKSSKPERTKAEAEALFDKAKPLHACKVWVSTSGIQSGIIVDAREVRYAKGKEKGEVYGYAVDVLTDNPDEPFVTVLPEEIVSIGGKIKLG